MKKIFILLLLLSAPIFAQEKFEIKNASKLYDLKIEVEKCTDRECEGLETVTLYRKNTDKLVQTIKVDDTRFNLNDDGSAPFNTAIMYDRQSAILFGDFDFDGIQDIALRDGNNSSYDGPSYQIYLYSPRVKRFVLNEDLTDFAQNNLGMFSADSKKKIITVLNKSGCCWHSLEEYRMVRNRPYKIFEEIQDAMNSDDGSVKITTKRRVNGMWRTTVKRKKLG